MTTKELQRLAANLERFLTLAGIPDDRTRAVMEAELAARLSAAGGEKYFLVNAPQGISLYNNQTLIKSFPAPATNVDNLLHFDGRKIAVIDRQAFLQNRSIVIIGAALGAAGGAAGDRSGTGGGLSSNNNNNNNNG